VPSGVSLVLKHLYSLTPERHKSCGQSSSATPYPLPPCLSRLSANLFCSLLIRPILAVHSLRQAHRFFSLYKTTFLAYYVFWVMLSIDTVAPASLLAFLLSRLLSPPKSFVRSTYEAHRVSQGGGANKLFGINAYKAAARC
jgi:hypothetical protein